MAAATPATVKTLLFMMGTLLSHKAVVCVF